MKHSITPYQSKSFSIFGRREDDSYALAKRTYEMAELDAFRDKLRASLCKQAMDNAAALATAEEQFIRTAPGGKDEYRLIVETYTRNALAEIIRSDW